MGGFIDQRYMEVVPSGSRMVFLSTTSAPLGWTVMTDAKYSAAGIRLTTNAASGGAYVTGADAFAGHTHTANHGHADTITATDGHSLSINEMPAHTHIVQEGSQSPWGSGEFLTSGDDFTRSPSYYSTSGITGSGAAHSHTIGGGVTSAFVTTGSFVPSFVNALACIKD